MAHMFARIWSFSIEGCLGVQLGHQEGKSPLRADVQLDCPPARLCAISSLSADRLYQIQLRVTRSWLCRSSKVVCVAWWRLKSRGLTQVGILHIQLVLSHLATETFTAEEDRAGPANSGG